MPFNDANQQNKKLKTESLIENYLFECEVCGKEYKNQNGLNSHSRIHLSDTE